VKALRRPPKRRDLDGYGTPPGVPPLADCLMAQQLRTLNALPPDLKTKALDGVPPEDIATDIPGTVQAAIAREAEDLGEAFAERTGILEFDGGLSRVEGRGRVGQDHGDLCQESGLPVGIPKGGAGAISRLARSVARWTRVPFAPRAQSSTL
jgi:hypothetical protein